MDRDRAVDPGRTIDWGKVSLDYALHRPGPPQRFFDALVALQIGLPRQVILDLGTGTGVMARRFAAQGAVVSAIDVAVNQISVAKDLAKRDGVNVDFQVAAAEDPPFADRSFDVISAMQCWLYFDPTSTPANVRRLLRSGGRLVVSYFSWLPRLDPIANQTERLVLKFNPNWTAGDWSGEIAASPSWTPNGFQIAGMFWFDEPVPFTRESWRGRIRACRGTGASLDLDVVAKFDAELNDLLAHLAPSEFTILHRLSAHIFKPLPNHT